MRWSMPQASKPRRRSHYASFRAMSTTRRSAWPKCSMRLAKLSALATCIRSKPAPPSDVIATTQGIGNLDTYRASTATSFVTMRSLLAAAGVEPSGIRSILDIGCGTGRLLVGWHCDDPRRRLEGAKALTGAARGGSDREELARRLRALSSILRDLGALLSRADGRCLANADLRPLLQRLQRSFDGERALRAFSAVDRALSALDRNASPKIVADWLAFQI